MRQLKFLVYSVADVPDTIVKVKKDFAVLHVYRRDPLAYTKPEACDAVFIAEAPKPAAGATKEEKAAVKEVSELLKAITAAYGARSVLINPKPADLAPKEAKPESEPEAKSQDG